MRKIITCAVAGLTMAAILIGVPAPAKAQNTAVVLDNVTAWWDHLSCPYMVASVNAIDYSVDNHASHDVLDGVEQKPAAPFNNTDAEREWCLMWAGLGANQQRALNYGAKTQGRGMGGITTKATDRVFDVAGWWDGMTQEGRQIAIGHFAYSDAGTDEANEQTDPGTKYSMLNVETANRVNAAYNALKGENMMTDKPTPTPAVPFVAVLMLGGALAARGAYLRRRR